jgi:hypothetical protein
MSWNYLNNMVFINGLRTSLTASTTLINNEIPPAEVIIQNNMSASMPPADTKPDGLSTGTGLFQPSSTLGIYSSIITKVVGTKENPFLPVNTPQYISALYNSLIQLKVNLPTIIKTELNKQLLCEFLGVSADATDQQPYPTNGGFVVSTNYLNTYIIAVSNNAKECVSYTPSGGAKTAIALYIMDNKDYKAADSTALAPDRYRNGAQKTVMFNVHGWLDKIADGITSVLENGLNNQLALVYAGDLNNFVVNGITWKYYQFLFPGDFVTFRMVLNSIGDGWDFFVTEYNSGFHLSMPTNAPVVVVNPATTLSLPPYFSWLGE